jgi:hypothetical protein
MKTKFLLLLSLAILIALPAFAATPGTTPCPPSSP